MVVAVTCTFIDDNTHVNVALIKVKLFYNIGFEALANEERMLYDVCAKESSSNIVNMGNPHILQVK